MLSKDSPQLKGFSINEMVPWQENYKEEVALMVQSGRRAEIEALYFHGYDYLGKYIAKKIVQSDYLWLNWLYPILCS